MVFQGSDTDQDLALGLGVTSTPQTSPESEICRPPLLEVLKPFTPIEGRTAPGGPSGQVGGLAVGLLGPPGGECLVLPVQASTWGVAAVDGCGELGGGGRGRWRPFWRLYRFRGIYVVTANSFKVRNRVQSELNT